MATNRIDLATVAKKTVAQLKKKQKEKIERGGATFIDKHVWKNVIHMFGKMNLFPWPFWCVKITLSIVTLTSA